MSDISAAVMARKIAETTETATGAFRPEFLKLVDLMCWDAVAYFAYLAKMIEESKFESIKGGAAAKNLVSTSHQQARNATTIPEGHAIGFFTDNDEIIHAMLSTGGGKACGTKNACIGIGGPVGWEMLDLTTLQSHADGTFGPRKLRIFHRPLSQAELDL